MYCTKLIPDFGTHLNSKLHHLVCTEYAGGAWNHLVGELLYTADADYDSNNTV
jgi:hypothetical protein